MLISASEPFLVSAFCTQECVQQWSSPVKKCILKCQFGSHSFIFMKNCIYNIGCTLAKGIYPQKCLVNFPRKWDLKILPEMKHLVMEPFFQIL